jgi:hypothetical protein
MCYLPSCSTFSWATKFSDIISQKILLRSGQHCTQTHTVHSRREWRLWRQWQLFHENVLVLYIVVTFSTSFYVSVCTFNNSYTSFWQWSTLLPLNLQPWVFLTYLFCKNKSFSSVLFGCVGATYRGHLLGWVITVRIGCGWGRQSVAYIYFYPAYLHKNHNWQWVQILGANAFVIKVRHRSNCTGKLLLLNV